MDALLQTIILGAVPTVALAVLGFFAKDKLTGIVESIAALVAEVKELRKELAEMGALRVRVERCELEIGELRERVRELEMRPAVSGGRTR